MAEERSPSPDIDGREIAEDPIDASGVEGVQQRIDIARLSWEVGGRRVANLQGAGQEDVLLAGRPAMDLQTLRMGTGPGKAAMSRTIA